MKNKQMVKIEDIQNMESIVENRIKKIVPKKTVNFMINSSHYILMKMINKYLKNNLMILCMILLINKNGMEFQRYGNQHKQNLGNFL